MDRQRQPLDVAVIATETTGTAGAVSIVDILAAVGQAWETLHGETRLPLFAPRLVTVDGAAIRGPGGLLVEPHGSFATLPRPDVAIIPDLRLDRTVPVPPGFGPVLDYLRAVHAAGGVVASTCSGSVVLAASGLLDGEVATTHWGYRDMIARFYPRVRLQIERVLVPAGDGHRLITAGGASSWHDLLLYLVARFGGPDQARRVAKVFLLQSHAQGQLPFAGLTALRQHEDEAIRSAQLWIADHYREVNPVAAMAAALQLSERGFSGRFRRATGLTPLAYVQTVRIEEAKQLLETTTMPVDEIAAEVGYSEPAGFRRLFRRMVGVTPSAYRRQSLALTWV